MRTALRLGLELTPVSLSGGPTRASAQLGALRSAAAAAEDAGFTTVWLGEGEGAPRAVGSGSAHPLGDPLAADGAVLAASLGTDRSRVHLGVMAGAVDRRHPSILAREVTALDHATGGRAALCLAQRDQTALADALAICRAMFADEDPVIDGPVFHVRGAFNHPPPIQAGGPPVVCALSAIPPDDILTRLAGQADALCWCGPLGGLGPLRAALGSPTPSGATQGAGPSGGLPAALLWAGEIPAHHGAGAELAQRLDEALVEGIIFRQSRSAPIPALGSRLAGGPPWSRGPASEALGW